MLGLDDETVAAVMQDYASAPIDERLRAMLGFLHKLTLEPESVSADDMAPLRAAGLSERAIEEAMLVAFCFNIMDRLADAFDFENPEGERYHLRCAQFLRRLGYGMASLPF